MKGVNGVVSDATAREYEQAYNFQQWVWEETNGDFWSWEYQQAVKRYDAAVARWNAECRGEV